MPHARTATPAQQVLVTQMLALDPSGSGAHLTVHDSALTAPSFMSEILAQTSAKLAAEKMVELSYKLATASLDAESSFHCDTGYKKLQNWASGTKPPYFRCSDKAATSWLSRLFAEVAQYGKHALNRADLFHCHLTYSAIDGDLLMVFHAKEYPSDLEQAKSGIAKALDNGIATFDTTIPAFRSRNPIYALRNNRIYVPHLSNNGNPYRALLGDPDLTLDDNPLFLDATILGDCLADISTFPREGALPFFTIWSVKANRPTCASCNKVHAEGSSTALGRWHYCSTCESFVCNMCGKWKLKRNVMLSRTRACSTCHNETSLVD